MPLILAFDTAAGRCAAAVFDGARRLAGREEAMARGHDARLFPMIDEALAEAGLGYGDLDLIAVGTGPGNFTGARLAVSAARGLALATGAEAVGVDRFAALAEGRAGRRFSPRPCARRRAGRRRGARSCWGTGRQRSSPRRGKARRGKAWRRRSRPTPPQRSG